MKSQRKLSTIVIKPQQQLRVALYFFVSFYLVTAVLIGHFIYSIRHTLIYLQEAYPIDPELMMFIQKYLYTFVGILFFSLIGFSILGFVMWLKLSHRIFGPLVPISRHITELQNGNYTSRVQLRENDFMTELRDELNLLAEKLQKK